MGIQPFYLKKRHPLWLDGSRAAHGKITKTGLRNIPNYSIMFIIYTYVHVVAGRIIKPGGPRVGYPRFKWWTNTTVLYESVANIRTVRETMFCPALFMKSESLIVEIMPRNGSLNCSCSCQPHRVYSGTWRESGIISCPRTCRAVFPKLHLYRISWESNVLIADITSQIDGRMWSLHKAIFYLVKNASYGW